MIGKSLSHYQILDAIGAGAMGVVYRARDERLKRDVAIKVLPPEALADETARKRFRQEALTLSQIGHPNIATIFDFDSQEGADFLVMELVDGISLEDRVASGPLPEKEILALGVQVAEALEAAHAKGIVHRDLKPANIGVTQNGHVKVLDFGLAQLLRPAKDDTTTESFRETKSIAGTLPYMAPEQLLGERIDGRADLYSLGVVLYRMAAGRLPFEHKISTALVNEILHMPPPPPSQINHKVSPRLEEIILRCMEKDAGDRYQTAADLRADLNRLKRQTESGVLAAPSGTSGWRRATQMPPRRQAMVAWSVVAIVIVGAVIGILWHPTPPLPPVPTHRQLTFTGNVADPAISPDGRSIAYVERTLGNPERLMVQDIGESQPLQIFEARSCGKLRWSPDGSAILCAAMKDSVGRVFLVPRLGGTPRRFAAGGVALAWSADGARFAAASRSGRRLIFTDRSTGDTTSVALGARVPPIQDADWSPRGDLLLLHAIDDRERHSIWSVRPDGTDLRRVFEDASRIVSPRWSPRENAIYFLKGSGPAVDLCKLRANSRSRKRQSTPQVILPGIQEGSTLTVSMDGRRILYSRATSRSNLWLFEPSASGHGTVAKATELLPGTGTDTDPSISPDGRRIAFARWDGKAANIFVLPIKGGAASQLTFMRAINFSPVWSPDGDEIAFGSNDGGSLRIWRVGTEGGSPSPFRDSHPAAGDKVALAWSPGLRILYQAPGNHAFSGLDPATGREMWTVPQDPSASVFGPEWSPDGDHVAFRWWKPSQRGVWVASTRNAASPSPALVYRADSAIPIGWSADGRWIYILEPRGANRRVLMMDGSGKGTRKIVMDLPPESQPSDLTIRPDGSRAVGSVVSVQTDAWVVDGFDPSVK